MSMIWDVIILLQEVPSLELMLTEGKDWFNVQSPFLQRNIVPWRYDELFEQESTDSGYSHVNDVLLVILTNPIPHSPPETGVHN